MPQLSKNSSHKSIYSPLLLCAALLVYAQSAFYQGFLLDDVIHILNNPLLTDTSGWKTLILEPVFPGNLYRPVTFLSFWIETQAFGLSAIHFHYVNVLLHGCCSLVLYLVLRQFSWGALALPTAFLFALHPVHTEVVTTIVGRAELLAFLFGMLGISALFERHLLIGILFFTLSALSKESGVLFPLLGIPLLWCEERAYLPKLLIAGAISSSVALLARSAVVGGITTLHEIPFLDNPIAALGPIDRGLNALALFGRYLLLCFVPFPISADYSYAEIVPLVLGESFIDLLIPLSVLSLFFTGLFLLKKRSLIGIAVVWFFSAFIITSNLFIPIGTIFSDRLLYTPSVGVCIFLAYLASQIRPAVIRLFLGFTFLFSYSAATFWYQQVWSNRNQLFLWQEKVSPKSVRTLVNLSAVYRNRNQLNRALLFANEAHQLYPDGAEPLFVLATIATENGNHLRAKRYLESALEKNYHFPPALIALGRLALNERDLSRSKKLLSDAIALEPRNIRALVSLYALAIAEQDVLAAKRYEEQISSYNRADREFLELKQQLDSVLSELTLGGVDK